MLFKEETLKVVGGKIKEADRILIIPHRNPDGDTIGSAMALYHSFCEMGKGVEVVCKDPAPTVFSFIPDVEQIKTHLSRLDYDLIFILDAGATYLTGWQESHPQLFDKTLPVVNIDHHPSNDYYGKWNIVVDDAASTTMILYEFMTQLNLPFNRNIATALLTGIYTDTGSMMHSNTTKEVYQTAAKLLSKGANLRAIGKDIFNTTPISTMRLWGRVLRNTYQTPDGVTMSAVMEEDFRLAGATYEEMTGVVDYVNSIPGAKYSVILTEREGKVKGSLRTLKDEIDVSAIAGQYGGGGHVKAAGFTIEGELEREVRWKVVK